MSISLGVVANVYNEANALPGWLEAAAAFFDDVRVVHAGPGRRASNDGTMEILERWSIPVVMADMNDGFGVVRTAAIHSSPCDYVMLLDADDRFLPSAQVLTCVGESLSPPIEYQVLQEYDTPTPGACPWNLENAELPAADIRVEVGEAYNQGAWLRDMLKDGCDAIVFVRRQWRDWRMTRPSQNWTTHPDLQTRVVRRSSGVRYDGKIHERLVGIHNPRQPNFVHGPFIEHLHLPLKMLEPGQRAEDIEVYRAIWRGTP